MKRTLRYTRNNCKINRNEFETFCSLREKSVCMNPISTWEGGVSGESVCPGDVSAESDFHSPRKCFQTITVGRYGPNGRTYSIYIYNVIIGDLRYFHAAKTYYYVALWVRYIPTERLLVFFSSDFLPFSPCLENRVPVAGDNDFGQYSKVVLSATAIYDDYCRRGLPAPGDDCFAVLPPGHALGGHVIPVDLCETDASMKKDKWRTTTQEIVILKLRTSNNIIAKLDSKLNSGWGANLSTLRTATLALVYITVEFSRAIELFSEFLNRFISGGFTNIVSPYVRREDTRSGE